MSFFADRTSGWGRWWARAGAFGCQKGPPLGWPRMVLARTAMAAVLGWAIGASGCGGSGEATADPAPFERAVVRYLEEHNMALAIKEIKEGPFVDGEQATMTASLTHAQLGGASVTWEFQFEADSDGTWKAVGHRD